MHTKTTIMSWGSALIVKKSYGADLGPFRDWGMGRIT